MKNSFNTAQHAFEYLYEFISKNGVNYANTKAIFNIGFYINNPLNNLINTPWRKWKVDYAQAEWKWYLSEDPNASEIAKRAKIWYRCMDENNRVNSNYGYQIKRGNQMEYIIRELSNNPMSRRASMSIYDAKENQLYKKDTPCTYAINFYVLNNKLNMSVLMRSNDLWYGFTNDQYCFSNYLKLIANRLNMPIGNYYHFANNLHLYENFLNKCPY
jgi:thymidylate synthase